MFPVDRTNWANQPWLLTSAGDLQTERLQAAEEGRDLSSVEDEFATLATLDLAVEANQRRAEALLDQVQTLPTVDGYAYREPSDLEGIRAERPAPVVIDAAAASGEALRDKALGAWLGRCAGCLVGKPVEGRRSHQIRRYLEAQGRWPLDDYFSATIDPDLAKECGFNTGWKALYVEGIDGMVEDDDTNYTVSGLAIVKRFGPDFGPEDVARFWLSDIPIFHVCTAERIAYRNLVCCVPPPASASVRNPYREWIGAQIRADFYGYVNPGNPERAAEYAWRDASISHIKNGIYGEMWVAAMLAAAYQTSDLVTIIRAGLAQVPAASRLTERIDGVLALHARGASYEQAIGYVTARWDENKGHDWCHTISNAEIVAVALLWGEMDMTRTICRAVMPGFDTDCNGATAGSVLGVVLGATNLPAKLTDPLNDTLYTGVAGYHRVAISQMADETIDLIARVQGA
ncbi:MAG: ADP-ribosylglycohydrolase family protein [Armatimonadetes bacterium]|nr:ADP-ribosylglycohydrolase family protein [Armatimonadota bacterium]